jgi:hypothetical protein
MSRMRLLTVSGRAPDKAAMAVWGRARRWCRMVARRRSARVRTGRRPTPGAISRGRWPRRLSRLISPLPVMRRHQRGDHGVPLLGRQAGQHRVAEPGQVGAGPVEWPGTRVA